MRGLISSQSTLVVEKRANAHLKFNRLIERLRAARSDVFKGEAWLLVGDGYMRTAVQLTIKQKYIYLHSARRSYLYT